eukprot:Protomagalhaensia_sp_Gyna_25__3343@NODE_301_length_3997_cov_103_531076_g233_i0_p2_GENE_NODE_301_length_3997_cov_103_531076_g233_i0NODE_301_length_3997_cov_103_531076_g233_i0_p2_ORF_typecomplete_len408_score68_06Cwf_Cwc_15/PF04889_12/0_33DNA_pol_phi/PF04931_13/6_5_NODE_301_length_3997_cov_103_531076_g233_i02881511
MSEQPNAFGKRPKNSIEAVLQNFKRCKIEKATRTWDWAAKELSATTNLREGSKIFVKFDVETTYTPDEDEEEELGTNTEEPDAPPRQRVKNTTSVNFALGHNALGPSLEITLTEEPEVGEGNGQDEDLLSEEEGGGDDDDDDDESGDDDDSTTRLGTTTARIEKNEQGKSVYVVNEHSVWWPAVVKRTEGPSCTALRDKWRALTADPAQHHQISPTMWKDITTYVEERGDAPIWTVQYEPRENFDSGDDLEWCAFFVDASTLIHLEEGRVCVAPYQKALEDGSCPPEEAPEFGTIDALKAAFGAGTSVIREVSAPLGCIPPNSIECMGKFGAMLRGFIREMERSPETVVTPTDVWRYFDKHAAAHRRLRDNALPLVSTSEWGTAKGEKDELEEAPFPRLPESPASEG